MEKRGDSLSALQHMRNTHPGSPSSTARTVRFLEAEDVLAPVS